MKSKRNLILFLFLSLSLICKSDTWLASSFCEYYSDNNAYKLLVTASKYPEKYHDWKYYMRTDKPDKSYRKEKRRFLRKITSADTTKILCRGQLYRISGVDTVMVWDRPFPNDKYPDSAIISNDGSFVVTFDNFGSLGFGLNVMVVYNGLGEVEKSYKLEEISPYQLSEYRKSVSSLDWKKLAKYIDNDRIEIEFWNGQHQIFKRIYNTKLLIFEK